VNDDVATLTSGLAQLVRSESVSFRRLADGTGVLVELDSGRVVTLNPTALFLAELLDDGIEDLSLLAAALAEDFEVDEATARVDIEKWVVELSEDLARPPG
jgi:hypothetical protein